MDFLLEEHRKETTYSKSDFDRVKQDHVERYGHQTIVDVVREADEVFPENLSLAQLEKTMHAIHETMPLVGEMKVLDRTKRKLAEIALSLNQKITPQALKAAIDNPNEQASEDIWEMHENEKKHEEKYFNGMLALEAADHMDELEEVYISNIITVILAAIQSHTATATPADIENFNHAIAKKLTLDEAVKLYQELIPSHIPTPLADRRTIPSNVQLLGTEFNCGYPSNYEIAEAVRENCPPVINDRIIRVAYQDIPHDYMDATVSSIGDYEAQVELNAGIAAPVLVDRLRHELGHVPERVLIDPEVGSYDFLMNLYELIKKDQDTIGKDIFSSAISHYPLSESQRSTPLKLAQEAVAEIWFLANNDTLLAKLKKELPNEFKILSMFYDSESELYKGFKKEK